MMRLQLLGDPTLMQQLRETQPELADAVANNPRRFAELLSETRRKQAEAELQRQREIVALNTDPFNIEAQKKIEEAIRMQAIMENMEHAMEFSPEAFGRVIMLYIPVEVNGHPVKAFVDSGAQQTIMSPGCAEACGIMRLMDTRFSGIAKGVGTAKILGRVHSAQMKVADSYLPCAFTIMEGRDVDLLLGLDMLKAHQACIDLEKGVLRIRGHEVGFLPEHELPKSSLHEAGELVDQPQASQPAGPSSAPSHFPGSGNTLGTSPSANAHRPPQSAPSAAAEGFPESHIATLSGLGCSRDEAIRLLQVAGGNVDLAASLLFQ
ncbi:DNA damage-inducible protein 1 [Tulasnella sp. 403]|nr:DNA damage-inducible protein 1 [Tulasnella sp. 403]